MDQAETLRKIMSDPRARQPGQALPVIAFSSFGLIDGFRQSAAALAEELGAGLARLGIETAWVQREEITSFSIASAEDLLIVSPGREESSWGAAVKTLRTLRREAGIVRFSMIVNNVTNGREGWRVFHEFSRQLGPFADIELEYLGHHPGPRGKNRLAVRPRSLLEFQLRAKSRTHTDDACLDLLAKRLRSRLVIP